MLQCWLFSFFKHNLQLLLQWVCFIRKTLRCLCFVYLRGYNLSFHIFSFHFTATVVQQQQHKQQPQQIEKYGRLFLKVFKERNFRLLFFSFGIALGSFYSLCTLLEQILVVVNYTSVGYRHIKPTTHTHTRLKHIFSTVGNWNFWFSSCHCRNCWCNYWYFLDNTFHFEFVSLTNIYSTFVAGFVTDRTRRYKEVMLVVYSGSFFSTLWFAFSVLPNNNLLLTLSCSTTGFFFTALIPVTFGLMTCSSFIDLQNSKSKSSV